MWIHLHLCIIRLSFFGLKKFALLELRAVHPYSIDADIMLSRWIMGLAVGIGCFEMKRTALERVHEERDKSNRKPRLENKMWSGC